MRVTWQLRRKLLEVRKFGLFAQLPAPEEISVFFLSGYMRSGTNMILDVFDKCREIMVYREADPRAFTRFSLKDDATLQTLVSKSRGTVVVFKALIDAHRLAGLAKLFPDSRILWPYRNYPGVIRSQLKLWPEQRENVDEILGEGRTPTWRGRGVPDETIKRLRPLYRPDLTVSDCKALGWIMRNAFLFGSDLPMDRLYMLRYEDVVDAPEQFLQDFSRLSGIEYQPEAVSHIRKIRRDPPPLKLDPDVRAACDDMLQRLDDLYQRQSLAARIAG